MLLEFLETGKVLYIMLAVSVLGILSKLLVNGRYKKLIKQSQNMGTAKDKYLKQWKVKFENTYRSNSGIGNIPVYVVKNLGQYKFMGVRLSRLSRFNSLAAALVCLGGLTAEFMTYWYARTTRMVALYSAAGILLGGAMVLWESICNTPGKEGRLLLYIRDYFENTLVPRLETGLAAFGGPVTEGTVRETGSALKDTSDTEAASEVRAAKETASALETETGSVDGASEEAAAREQDAQFLRKRLERIASGRRGGGRGRKLTKEEEHLIEDIIQEYLYE